MMTVTILCDGCGRDITWTGNSVDYRIVLASERMSSGPGFHSVTDMMIYPPIEPTRYFCTQECLCRWMVKEYPGLLMEVPRG